MNTEPANKQTFTKPPSSFRHYLDAFIGPGATFTELCLQFIPPILFALAVSQNYAHSPIRTILTSILALDLLGGVLTNSTTAAKKWYHGPNRTRWDHLSFIALHVIHLATVASIFRGMSVSFFLSASMYLALASVLIVYVDAYVQRPVAMLLYCGALLMDLYVWKPTPSMPWFVPLFYLKLLVTHLLPS